MSKPQQPAKKAAPTAAQVATKIAKLTVRANNKRNRKAAKMYGNQLLERVGSPANLYLKCLLNPEQYQTSYPDEFGDKTAVCSFVTNTQLQWDADGNYFAWINPTLNSQLVMRQVQTAATVQYSSSTLFAKGHPVKPGPEQTVTLTNFANSNGTTLTYTDGVLTLPKLSSNSTAYASWAGNGALGMNMLFDNGTVVSLTNDITAGATIPLATKTIAFQLSVAGSTAYSATQINVNLVLNQSQDAVSTLVPINVPSYSDLVGGSSGDGLQPICEEYRTVAMSTLVTYEGDTLYNGGNITARIVDGGDSPVDLGLTSYSAIASLPDSYERPLTMGCYSFWKPTDEKDMFFRDPTSNNSDGDLPSLVVAGTVKNVSNAIIRIRICQVVEMKTYKPFMSTAYSVVDPAQISAAAVALRGIPRIMENPLHLEDIKKFLKDVASKGQQMYEMGQKIAPYAIPIAKAVGSFLL